MKFNGSKWTNYNKQNYPQLPSNAYYNVFAGPDSAVYLSNWGNGVTILKNNSFTFYNAINSPLPGINKNSNFAPISDIKTDSKGNVWILSDEAVPSNPLNVLTSQKQWYSYSFSNFSLSSNITGPLLVDQYDTKWFVISGNNAGLYYFNENNTFDNLSDDVEGFLNNNSGLLSTTSNILSLAIDKNGYLWIGNDNGLNAILILPVPVQL